MIVATLRPTDGTRIAWPTMSSLPPVGSAVGRNGSSSSSSASANAGCSSLLRLELTSPADTGSSTAAAAANPAAGSTAATGSAYPINWLRNAGISCVGTSHYFIVDVDFWPSGELLPLLRAQLGDWKSGSSGGGGSGTPPRALVVPNFQRSGHGCRNAEEPGACREALERGEIVMPPDFAALQTCLGAKDCVVFDGEYNPQGQASTDVKAWRSQPAGATRRVPCITSERYEPYVVLQRDEATPLFDERFTGYGKNKVQLIVHLRRAGYAFEVVARGFVIHFPHHASDAKHHWLHSSAHKTTDRLFSNFIKELAARHGSTPPITPLCGGESQQQLRRRRGATGAGGNTSSSSGGGGDGGSSTQQRLDRERARRKRELMESRTAESET